MWCAITCLSTPLDMIIITTASIITARRISNIKRYASEIEQWLWHLLAFYQAYHKAKGANASWESLSNLAPCIPLYRRLKTQLAPSLGLRHSGTRHTPANTSSLVDRVTAKARELEIEKTITNRQTESGFQAVDILKFGGELTRGKSMKSFHKRYTKWAKATLPISLATCSEDDMQESDEDE